MGKFIRLLLIGVCAGILVSCNKPEVEEILRREKVTNIENSRPSSKITLQEAKGYYERKMGLDSSRREFRTSGKEKFSRDKVIWELAGDSNKPDSNLISVPLGYGQDVTLVNISSDSDSDKMLNVSFNKVVFYKEEDGSIASVFIQMVPDKEYSISKGGIIDQEDFTGFVIVSDMNENIIGLLRYENGSRIDMNLRNARVASSCYTVTHYVRVCSDVVGCDVHPNYTETVCIPNNGTVTFTNGGRPTFSFSTRLPMPQDYEEVILFNKVKMAIPKEFGATQSDYLFYFANYNIMPQAARNFTDANKMAIHWFCNNLDDNNANAFKHAFWSGLNYIAWGADLARDAAAAHEDLSNPIDYNTISLTSRMDMTNNHVGFGLAEEYKREKGNAFFADMHTQDKRDIINREFGNKVVKACAVGMCIVKSGSLLIQSNANDACKTLPTN